MSLWRTSASKVVYENPWIRVRHDEVVRPDGSAGVYGVVAARHLAVFVVAVAPGADGLEGVLLVTLDRYTVGPSIEVPAGGTDGEDPLAAAQRELLEEAAMTADGWTELGEMNALNGFAQARGRVFLARGLRHTGDAARTQHEEGITGVELVPWEQVLQMIADGRIKDSETVSALALAAIHLGRLR